MLDLTIGIRVKVTNLIPRKAIVEEKIVVSDINYSVMEGRWVKSQLNSDT